MNVNYSNKKILIWGITSTGLSCINFFVNKRIYPRVIDTRTKLKQLHLFRKIPKYIQIKLGENIESWIFSSDLIVISPSISLFHPLLLKANQLGIEIIGDIELFCRENKKPIIAITGSNGKNHCSNHVTKNTKKLNTYYWNRR
ncbi:hypothetical protein HIC20_02145 [Buchnera aphidicola (Hormaphis cornu)]|nr:hypothetical protein HIC20_02145 [Buchnera aphidicola (Hormaphis cornu)]